MPIASSLLNKPRLVKKLKDFYEYVKKNNGQVGQKTRGIDLNFNNACNLRCKYCFKVVTFKFFTIYKTLFNYKIKLIALKATVINCRNKVNTIL